jgi:molecular chaperone IbpA
MDSIGGFEGEQPGFPPYNIEKTGDNDYRITMAVAGFGDDDLNVEVKENVLTISGERQTEEPERVYLHQGIAGRSFKRRFQLADHVEVRGAELKNGLLHIDFVREIPEAMKPRSIEIRSTNGSNVVLENSAGEAA